MIQPDTSLSAILPPPATMSRCGIYRLHFDDGEQYIGQTVNLLARFGTHQRKQAGTILKLEFCPVARAELNQVERDEIALAKQDGWPLRNIDLVNLPISSTALESYVEPGVQEAWLNGDTDLVLGRRTIDREAAERTKPNFDALKKHPSYPKMVSFYADYVARCIPYPHRTERRFWSMTSYPTTNKSKTHHRLSALCINNVEVVVFFDELADDGSWHLGAFLNCAGDTRVPFRLRRSASAAAYVHVGEVVCIEMNDDRWWHALDDKRVAAGARELSMGLLRKGNGMMSRFHDYNLAGAVFAKLRTKPVGHFKDISGPKATSQKRANSQIQIAYPC